VIVLVVTCLFTRVICGESPKVNQRRWTKVCHRQLVHLSTSLITSVERNCLHGSLWLTQLRWSTWGTRVNTPLHTSSCSFYLPCKMDTHNPDQWMGWNSSCLVCNHRISLCSILSVVPSECHGWSKRVDT